MKESDEVAITDLFERLCAAWGEGDAAAYGACFTEDADYVSFDGTRARGRAPMVEAHDKLFRGVLAGSRLVGEVESIRLLSSDVAVVHATGSVLMPWRSKLPRRRLSRQTLVAVRAGEGWLFTLLHNTRVRPLQVPEPAALPSRLSHGLARASAMLGVGRH